MTALPLARVLLIVSADMLAVAGGVTMFLRTGKILWAVIGLLISLSITLIFLVPILRAAAAAAKTPTESRIVE